MEGDTLASELIFPITKLEKTESCHGSINLLEDFIEIPDIKRMAIKETNFHNKYHYSVPLKSPYATISPVIHSDPPKVRNNNFNMRHTDSSLHYAQIALTTDTEDSRSTGGGEHAKNKICRNNSNSSTLENNVKKKYDQQNKRVSFKIRNASNFRRPPIATKTMTITSSKVSELTKKFNNLIHESNGAIKPSKLVKTIEDLQITCHRSGSNSSTPSSTLSSSPNIKIVFRHRRNSKKRSPTHRKRCSSADSIENIKSHSTEKIQIIRSKSDGTKKPKASKKRLKYQESKEDKHGVDCVDGKITDKVDNQADNNINSNVVKNAVKKFECEINSKTQNGTLKSSASPAKEFVAIIEKPKVPEKKVSLLVTKNIVVKDGIPKIKTLKQPVIECKVDSLNNDMKKIKEYHFDKKKYKTNYIHSEKLSIHAVDIIHEDIGENPNPIPSEKSNCTDMIEKAEKIYQDISSRITPNDSFLWRRKSNSQIYSDSDRSLSDGPYSLLNISNENNTIENKIDETKSLNSTSDNLHLCESQINLVERIDKNLDFESNLVEAVNKEVLVGFTTKPKKEFTEEENDYEPLELMKCEEVAVLPAKTSDNRLSLKLNCPLPEIPKENNSEAKGNSKTNIYQCLLEMRSHPEGDESSNHSYESCDNDMEERTRGDGDSDDGYEYCKNPIKPYCLVSSSGLQITDYKSSKNYEITKSVSGTSTVSYEKIGSDRIYEKIPARPERQKNVSPSSYSSRNSVISSEYISYNDGENIYDTIKLSDGTSLSHCYESIPNSPSLVKLRNNFKKQLASAVQKRLSFDQESNISHSTLSSEQKTNSIYGRRSMLSYNGQEINSPVANSDTSSSDRSDDWIDVSDEEKYDEQKIIIVRERSRGRKSPISWSQKVRHQWSNSPKQQVSITSSSKVYIGTSTKSPHYSQNDEDLERKISECERNLEEIKKKIAETLQQSCWLTIRTILRDGNMEVQDHVAFIEGDTNDSCPVYESLEPPPPAIDDFDSFDSDSESDTERQTSPTYAQPPRRLPEPPVGGGTYTLTKIASVAQRKMRELKRNLTKKYAVAVDGKTFMKPSPTNGQKTQKSPIYANYEKHKDNPELIVSPVYSKVNAKIEPAAKMNGFKDELKTVIGEKRLSSNGDAPEKPVIDKPITPTIEQKSKESGTLSRKTYFSFKSRFRRANSLAVDASEVPSALKITNSTFYLNDSVDGDSGFSNCSDNVQSSGSVERLQGGTADRRDGTRVKREGRGRAESTPCLTLQRPAQPPPPPPQACPPNNTDLGAVQEELKRLLPSLSRKDKSPRTRTSWYAECGSDDVNILPVVNTKRSSTSWYAEAGLYQAGNISSSSGASSGSRPASHPASPLPHSLFTHEPLYQFYNAAKVESACRETGDSDSELYSGGSAGSGTSGGSGARPSAMALVALAAPARGPARTLWCEVPEVVNSTVLSSLAPAQKRLQEAKFELLTSEASYLNSLNVLETHFISHPAFRDPHLLTRADRDVLFATILPVRKCSQLLMNELEKCWQENILLQGLCDIVRRHADDNFHVYVKYCENQTLMVKALQSLRERPAFASALKRLEGHPACQCLSLHSFLMLPMQRITRLPLLMDAVLRNLNEADGEYQSCMDALATLNNFVSQCNEGARNTERIEEMFRLSKIIEFPINARNPPLLGPACSRRDRRPTRWLVRSGEVTQIVWKTDDQLKLTFGKKFHKIPLHLFLFNDLLVITKKKSDDNYVAVDWCARSMLEVCGGEQACAGAKHALLLTLLENHHSKTVEMVMSCPTETDSSRWAEALAGDCGGGEGEAVYAGWDCPQVAAVYAYPAAQPDELALAEGDVVNVTRKTNEGWYYGERIRDGEAGWFPGSYTVEIASPHVRARNLRQRYRLLALSATYLGQMKKPLS